MSQKINVFLDLDGVLVNLHKELKDQFNFEFPKDQSDENRQKIHDLWYMISDEHPGFWSKLAPMQDYRIIYEACLSVDPHLFICSATPEPFTDEDDWQCAGEKRDWVWHNLGWSQCQRTIITKSKLKQNWMRPGDINILVDDHIANIKRWNKAGGVGIHHYDLQTTLKELAKWK